MQRSQVHGRWPWAETRWPAGRVVAAIGLALMAGGGATARAATLDSPTEGLMIETHGFVSQGLLKSTGNNYLADSKRGSFEMTEMGVNFTATLTERLRVGMQIFSRKLGPVGNFDAKADWFYLDYRWKDWLGVRAGRVKLPFGLYNDTSDIDSARVPVLLPQSVYPSANRDFLLAQTGAEIYGFIDLRTAGALDYHLYAGSIFFEFANQPGSPVQVAALSNPYLLGGSLMWGAPVDGLRLGGSVQALKLDTTLLFATPAAPAPVSVTGSISAVLWVASAEYAARDLLLAAEYSRWHTSSQSDNPMLFPAAKQVSERAYAMASLRLRPWLTPGTYYSMFFRDVGNRKGFANLQHDVAATLRFDINTFWLVKLEGHYMRGYGDVAPALNVGNAMKADWALFLLKTTAYF